MIKCQGEEITFTIEVINQDGSFGDINKYENIIVHAKCGCRVVKYSKKEITGYIPLIISGNILGGTIEATDTNQMLGELEFELITEEDINGDIVTVPLPKENSGIKIVKKS